MSAHVEQPLPTKNDSTSCQDTLGPVISVALENSKERGEQTYGTALQPFNGRDVYRDAFEEWMDLGIYLEQWRRERNQIIVILKDLANEYYDTPLGKRASDMLTNMGQRV